jgi:hypothetical protein
MPDLLIPKNPNIFTPVDIEDTLTHIPYAAAELLLEGAIDPLIEERVCDEKTYTSTFAWSKDLGAYYKSLRQTYDYWTMRGVTEGQPQPVLTVRGTEDEPIYSLNAASASERGIRPVTLSVKRLDLIEDEAVGESSEQHFGLFLRLGSWVINQTGSNEPQVTLEKNKTFLQAVDIAVWKEKDGLLVADRYLNHPYASHLIAMGAEAIESLPFFSDFATAYKQFDEVSQQNAA